MGAKDPGGTHPSTYPGEDSIPYSIIIFLSREFIWSQQANGLI